MYDDGHLICLFRTQCLLLRIAHADLRVGHCMQHIVLIEVILGGILNLNNSYLQCFSKIYPVQVIFIPWYKRVVT